VLKAVGDASCSFHIDEIGLDGEGRQRRENSSRKLHSARPVLKIVLSIIKLRRIDLILFTVRSLYFGCCTARVPHLVITFTPGFLAVCFETK
jgi:hypothetical protein